VGQSDFHRLLRFGLLIKNPAPPTLGKNGELTVAGYFSAKEPYKSYQGEHDQEYPEKKDERSIQQFQQATFSPSAFRISPLSIFFVADACARSCGAHFIQTPNVVNQSSFHRPGHAQR
jgi:hypothetical protein